LLTLKIHHIANYKAQEVQDIENRVAPCMKPAEKSSRAPACFSGAILAQDDFLVDALQLTGA